ALASLERASTLALASTPPLPSAITALAHQVRVHRVAERRDQAREVVERGRAVLDAQGWARWPIAGELMLERAMLERDEGRLDAAERAAMAGLRLLRLGDEPGAVARGLLGLTMIRRARGDRAGVRDAAAKAEAAARAAGIPMLVEAIAREVAMDDVPPRSSPEPAAEVVLSEREREVLSLVARGLPNRLIARQLFIAPVTVKTHVHNILGKLSARNRTEAVHQARSLGLLE
ncbi:MAG: hypothetical protein KDK70_41425, partial [Myxococcales bacterium]|nr:hypothetical protein [Myxococcales bacterium]